MKRSLLVTIRIETDEDRFPADLRLEMPLVSQALKDFLRERYGYSDRNVAVETQEIHGG